MQLLKKEEDERLRYGRSDLLHDHLCLGRGDLSDQMAC
jgi:hypothetical protein